MTTEYDAFAATYDIEMGVGLYGGFARQPFDASSTEQVWVARKPESGA